MTNLFTRALAAYVRFCLHLLILAGEALGDAVLYLASFMPGHNEEQRVTSLVIACYATPVLFAGAQAPGRRFHPCQ